MAHCIFRDSVTSVKFLSSGVYQLALLEILYLQTQNVLATGILIKTNLLRIL